MPRWSSKEQFELVLETAPMNEAEFSTYCQERRLYPKQVENWRSSCMNASARPSEDE